MEWRSSNDKVKRISLIECYSKIPPANLLRLACIGRRSIICKTAIQYHGKFCVQNGTKHWNNYISRIRVNSKHGLRHIQAPQIPMSNLAESYLPPKHSWYSSRLHFSSCLSFRINLPFKSNLSRHDSKHKVSELLGKTTPSVLSSMPSFTSTKPYSWFIVLIHSNIVYFSISRVIKCRS